MYYGGAESYGDDDYVVSCCGEAGAEGEFVYYGVVADEVGAAGV